MSEDRSVTPLPHSWPFFRILSAVRMAFDVRKIAMATIGLLLLWLGWSILDRLFPGSADVTPELKPPPGLGRLVLTDVGRDLILGRLGEPFRALAQPISALFHPSSGGTALAHALLAIAWLLVVWGPISLAIGRLAAIQAAQSRLGGIGEALRFARIAGPSMILAILYPMAGIVLLCLPGLAIGWLYRIPGGDLIAGLLLFLPLLCGLVMALFAASVLAGWALFPAAIATGAEDALDALGRTYSYMNQRLVVFVMAIAIAAVAGVVGLVVVDLLTAAVFRFSAWSLSLDGPSERIVNLFAIEPNRAESLAMGVHRFWLDTVRLVAHAWVYSYFWTAATMVYLGLRQMNDGTPFEVIDPPDPDA